MPAAQAQPPGNWEQGVEPSHTLRINWRRPQ
jgi:hypothetical protein